MKQQPCDKSAKCNVNQLKGNCDLTCSAVNDYSCCCKLSLEEQKNQFVFIGRVKSKKRQDILRNTLSSAAVPQKTQWLSTTKITRLLLFSEVLVVVMSITHNAPNTAAKHRDPERQSG